MRGQSMLYKTRFLQGSIILSLVIGLAAVSNSYAQGIVTLMEEDEDESVMELTDNSQTVSLNETIPDEISLTGNDTVNTENNEASGFISPQTTKSSSIFEDETLEEFSTVTGSSENVSSSVSTAFSSGSNMGDSILDKIDSDLFSKMSELEKQTTLLNLELRRERVKTEIEAIRAQRRKAEQEEREAEEEKRRKQIEWEKEQERKIIEEQRKLKEAEIAFEALRQEKVVRAYKATMLDEIQKWIIATEVFFKDYKELERQRDEILTDTKSKLSRILEASGTSFEAAKTAKENYLKEANALKNQITILKSRLEAMESEKNVDKENPFAIGVPANASISDTRLNDEYAIMEIRGRDSDLVATLVNREGRHFMVRVGTVLQTGHIVDEITQTYIRADMGGQKDYIYFAAGGIMDREPQPNEVEILMRLNSLANDAAGGGASSQRPLSTSQGVPSLNEGMFVKE